MRAAGAGPTRAAASGSWRPFTRRLPIPRVLTGPELTIPIVPARVQVLPGRKTPMWTFGGTFPGPTIRRPAGQRTTVTFRHRLGAEAGELSIHLHGGHTSSEHDGHPGGLTQLQPRSLYCDIEPGTAASEAGNDLLIPPGGERTYTYELSEHGGPERSAFQWYHDHRLDRTGRNVWRGLAGMWIVDDEHDASLPLPRGRRDIPLLIADRAFDRGNRLRDPAVGAKPPFDHAQGRHVLVNGALLPFHQVSARRHRLRILNASNFRAYNLYLTGGVRIVQIATESGLMPAPLERRRVLVGPGERVELIVDFAPARGKRVELRSGPRHGGAGSVGSSPYRGPLMEFRVGPERVPDRTSIPATLRPLPAWVEELGQLERWHGPTPPAPDHVWRVTVGRGLNPSWLINGRTFDPARAQTEVRLGSVVVWELRNDTEVAHLMHPHATDWLLLSRDGKQPPRWERCLKETFLLEPRSRAMIAGKLSDHLGKFVLHCHMLEHEDHGLMSQFEVVGA